jgi:hypothetical protein
MATKDDRGAIHRAIAPSGIYAPACYSRAVCQIIEYLQRLTGHPWLAKLLKLR